MPAMMRPSRKARKIAHDILGTPPTLRKKGRRTNASTSFRLSTRDERPVFEQPNGRSLPM